MEVWTESQERLEAELGRLNHKASRIGAAPILYKFLRSETRTRTVTETYQGTTTKTSFPVLAHLYEVSGLDIAVDGWTIVGEIHPGDPEPVFITTPHPGTDPVDFSPYRSSPFSCDHCKAKRYRKQTYIIRHTDGREMRIGSACLRGYVGKDQAAIILFRDHIHHRLAGEGEDYWWDDEVLQRRVRPLFRVRDLIVWAEYLKEDMGGWVFKCTGGPSTNRIAADHVREGFLLAPGENFGFKPDLLRKAEESYDRVREFFRKLPPQEPGSFGDKLAAALAVERVPWEFASLTAYAGQWMRSEEAKAEREREAVKSRHVGQIGDRVEMDVDLVHRVTYNNRFTGELAYIYMLKDIDGNRLKWFTGVELDAAVGDILHIRGTVKDHVEYNGAEETVLTRVRVSEEKVDTTGVVT